MPDKYAKFQSRTKSSLNKRHEEKTRQMKQELEDRLLSINAELATIMPQIIPRGSIHTCLCVQSDMMPGVQPK